MSGASPASQIFSIPQRPQIGIRPLTRPPRAMDPPSRIRAPAAATVRPPTRMRPAIRAPAQARTPAASRATAHLCLAVRAARVQHSSPVRSHIPRHGSISSTSPCRRVRTGSAIRQDSSSRFRSCRSSETRTFPASCPTVLRSPRRRRVASPPAHPRSRASSPIRRRALRSTPRRRPTRFPSR